jgi:hypothetical protein
LGAVVAAGLAGAFELLGLVGAFNPGLAGAVVGLTDGDPAASVGSPEGAGLLVVPVPPPPPDSPPPQAPSIVAILKIKANPKIRVLIAPLSPIVARITFRLMNKIPYLLLLLLFFYAFKFTG